MNSHGYGGQRPTNNQQNFEAPACVQNAMMTKDKKPFTYTPGGIDLSQIKSERMAKRLARNAQAEGTTGAQQQNRPAQPQSPHNASGAAATIGAAAMGMPFQVLPPPPPPPQQANGKNLNGTPAPPPPPPNSNNLAVSNASKASGSPSLARKSPTPQRFEPPPLGFRPEIKIPPNPMAALRKVPPPVEKNTFWKDAYIKERSKSPMPGDNEHNGNGNGNTNANIAKQDNNGAGSTNITETDYHHSPQNSNANAYSNDVRTAAASQLHQREQQQQYTPPATPQQWQQQQQQQQKQPQPSPLPEFRSVAAPQSPAVNVYTRQTDSPRAVASASAAAETAARSGESPFRFAQQQQQQQQQQHRAAPAISPLAQQQQAYAQQQQQHQNQWNGNAANASNTQTPAASQNVPWRTQRNTQTSTPPQPQSSHATQSQSQSQPQAQLTSFQPKQSQSPAQAHPHPQPIFNNVHTARPRDVFSPTPAPTAAAQQRTAAQTPMAAYQQEPSKPSNVGSLYIAPLAAATSPSPQIQQQPQQQQPTTVRWMSSQPMQREQPIWARAEENGNVVPSSLNRLKSPPPTVAAMQQQQLHQQQQQQQPPLVYQQYPYPNTTAMGQAQNFGAHANAQAPVGLRLQINNSNNNNNMSTAAGKERIIPIQLEQTPTYAPAHPNFANNGNNSAPTSYVIRTPNQFVDQGYQNFNAAVQQQQQQHQQQPQQQQQQHLNSPRLIQQQQQSTAAGNRTRIIPIAMESGNGIRGPISQSPIIIQNDQRLQPVQSKSFRILQKITNTVDDADIMGDANAETAMNDNKNLECAPSQLQRPQFARQMSAQQARHSPTIEKMRQMQLRQEQGNSSQMSNQFLPQRNVSINNNDLNQTYVRPSEQQQAHEPKIYTGSAIPSRSFKILQAMTTPENAGPGQSDL